jgi:NDP-sugar pyrophosphorylase family protein
LHFAEKSEIFVSEWINCGVYVFSKAAFDLDIYREFGEKYKGILGISKDEDQEKHLSNL